MTETARTSLEELRNVAAEIYKLSQQLKELRLRKKELEKDVIEYLESKEKPAVKYQGIVFQVAPKVSRGRKKKDEALIDCVKVLQAYGVNDPKKALEEIKEAMKGQPSEVSTLKMKQANMFDL